MTPWTDEHQGQIVFVVDCDDDVPRGKLVGSDDLIITQNADLETDLLKLGVITPIVLELVDSALASETACDEIAQALLERAGALAECLGKIRWAARNYSIPLDIKLWDFFKADGLRAKGTSEVDEEAVILQVVRACSLRRRDEQSIRADIAAAPPGYRMCKGHDLVGAAEAVLFQDFRVPARKAGALDEMIRLACNRELLQGWSVIQRIRRWEGANRKVVFAW